eukprot:TRINITY_DN651_c0_g1_i1.p1 TRINITY_DN651_c0_g1~~TRINITY_DN651_c0_g1_i1.p1  ORF type:complete len:307 (+),score=109.93 TRINITY_DN651_c0_g1_i1:205-1125(+)
MTARPWALTYMLQQHAADVRDSGHLVTDSVYMQSRGAGWLRRGGDDEPMRVVGETEVMQGIAAMAESGKYGACNCCAGIVGTVDMMLGDGVRAVLQEHMRSRNFRGVRYLGGRAEQIDFGSPKFVAAARVLAELGLVLDVNGPETHPLQFGRILGGIAAVARTVPELTVVLDHCGGALGPRAFEGEGGGERRAEWEHGMAELAALPNVRVKVGGLQMPANGFPLQDGDAPVGSERLAALTGEYYGHVLRLFGARRCMAESNFPMDRWGVGYGVWWNTLKRVASAAELSADDRDWLFWRTAATVYRL